MKRFFTKIKSLGITPETNFHEKNRLEIFNSVTFTAILICLSYSPVMLYYGAVWGFVQNMFYSIVLSFCLWLNYKTYTEISKHVISISSCFYFLAFAYLYGEAGQAISLIEVMPMLIAILFNKPVLMKKYLIIILLTIAGTYYFYWFYKPVYYIDTIKYLGASSSLFGTLIIFFIMHYFKDESVKNENKITEQSLQLKDAFEELNQQNEEISTQRDEIENQKILVEEHQKEMIDSITYAKRIQDAILPPIDFIQQYLPNTFVVYRPKDIIAGDFFWMHVKQFDPPGRMKKPQFENANSTHQINNSENKLIFVAAADCTGHGVPGAMVSVVCSNALNRAVKEFLLTQPGEILDKVRELVIETFEKSGEDIKDGMDISLMSIEYNYALSNDPIIKWSGANNALYIVDPAQNLFEIKADKQPIGKSDSGNFFTTHHIPYTAGSTFYLMTDGYPDQFGGPKGKKFKYKPLEELLTSISTSPVLKQSKILDQKFNDWKGELEQVDDVTIIGIKI